MRRLISSHGMNPDTWPAFVDLVGNDLAALVGQQLGRIPMHP
ncbi:hypothetical protein [Gordonia sputi]